LDTRLHLSRKWSEPADLWSTFFALVQKAHFKTRSIPKLQAAINVYAGLAHVPSIMDKVLLKLSSMLLHPYPKVRIAAAEVLYTLTNDDDVLAGMDWTREPKTLKDNVSNFKARLEAAVAST